MDRYSPEISDLGELTEKPIPTSLEDFRELFYLVFLLKSEHGQKLLYSLTMRFEMGPRLWAVLDSNQRPPPCKGGALTS